MPISLGGPSARATSSDPTDLLLECHDRIRHAMRQAFALADAAADAAGVAATAAAVHRYFSVALPLHAADEDVSVGPRLSAAGLSEPLASAVVVMTAQHQAIDGVLERLLPLWRRIAEEPRFLDECRDALRRDTTALDALWDEHLDLEERVVFPLISTSLPRDVLADIAGEMRARRTVGDASNR